MEYLHVFEDNTIVQHVNLNMIPRKYEVVYDFEPPCIIHIECGSPYEFNISSKNFTKESPLRIGLLCFGHIMLSKPCKFKGAWLLPDETKKTWYESKEPVKLDTGDEIIYDAGGLYPTPGKQHELQVKRWKSLTKLPA